MATTPVVVGDYVSFEVGSNPPPGVDINANSAMLVTAVSSNERGGTVTVSRQGRIIGTFPTALMTEVRAP